MKAKMASAATVPYPMNPCVRTVINGRQTAARAVRANDLRLPRRHESQHFKTNPTTAKLYPLETSAVTLGRPLREGNRMK